MSFLSRTVFVSAKTNHDVLVAGAGPVGLMLATELQLAGARVLVVERREDLDTATKAEGINAASAEAFERRGLLPSLLALHRPYSNNPEVVGSDRRRFAGHFGGIQVPADPVDEDDPALRDRGPAGWGPLQVPQVEVERILGQRAAELGVEVRRGAGVCAFDEDEAGVTVALERGDDVRVAWLVGCDGGHSWVRRLAGIEFVGTDPELTGRHGSFTVEGAEHLPRGWQYTPNGLYVIGPMPGRLRTVEFDGPPAEREAPVTAAEMEASLRRVSGVDVRVTDVISSARFTDNARQATTYRRGRVLLCGDAAHVHSPFSGQGLNLGIGDAVNLGWKLAATVQRLAPDDLLDTYTSERHPIGAWVLDWTRAQVAVMRGDPASSALRAVVTDFLDTRDGATHYVKSTSGLAQRYDMGDGHPLVGAMMPNLRLDDGTRLADHADDGRAFLVDLAGDDRLADLVEPYARRVKLIRTRPDGAELSGLLVRPDGFVAWAAAGDASDHAGLQVALTRWLGADALARFDGSV
jgi:2-polyprenyl-6-methoxyphenol hydroxylase-like FAD-dependent oxidoreductase